MRQCVRQLMFTLTGGNRTRWAVAAGYAPSSVVGASAAFIAPRPRDQRARAGRCAAILLALCLVLLPGCTGGAAMDRINPRLRAGYAEPMAWAVAPVINESGVSVVDPVALADVIAGEVQRVEGINLIPVQRVLDAMRALDIGRVESVTDAESIARVVGANALLVGTLTAWDPYAPPRIGLTLQLYAAEGPGGGPFDTRVLSAAASDRYLPGGESTSDQPVASASNLFDGADNALRLDLMDFAAGRTKQESAFGWERFLVQMDLFAEYAANRLLADLLSQERLRVARGQGP